MDLREIASPVCDPSDIEQYRERRRRQDRDRRVLNHLPLAHRIAAEQMGTGAGLGQAMVGLLEAADDFEADGTRERFGAYAETRIISALERHPDAEEVTAAQAHVAATIASQARVRALAGFLQVPVSALVGGLMDAAVDVPPPGGPSAPFRGAA